MSNILPDLIAMGFTEEKSKKAVDEVGQNMEAAVQWIVDHIDEDNMDTSKQNTTEAPTEEAEKTNSESAEVAASYKCGECGKQFANLQSAILHAERQNHPTIEESNIALKPLTEEEKKERQQKLVLKLQEVKKKKAEQEQKCAIEMEKKRRLQSKEIAEAKAKATEREMKELAEERRQQKLNDKVAKQKVLDQIKADREARKNQQQSATEPISSQPPKQPVVDANETKIQIRLPNGKALINTFKSTETLAAVRLYAQMNRLDIPEHLRDAAPPIYLQLNYPKKKFTDEDMQASLKALNLVPSAVIITANQP